MWHSRPRLCRTVAQPPSAVPDRENGLSCIGVLGRGRPSHIFNGLLWCGGPDENRFRWLKGGWVRTVVGSKPDQYKWPKDAVGVPAERVFLCWNAVVATDSKGGVYLSCSGEPNGLWRAFSAKEARP